MSDVMEKHLLISGRVQGVGFRYFTRKNAQKIGVTGFVKNLPDGNVETAFRGTPDQVQQMEQLVSDGPAGARVDNVEELEPTGEQFRNFKVRR